LTIHHRLGLVLLAFTLLGVGCTKYDPVPVSDCSKVVRHVKKVIGKSAPKSSELKAQCKAGSDQDRGCVMAATSPADLMRCSM
jgi:hypothetical protein